MLIVGNKKRLTKAEKERVPHVINEGTSINEAIKDGQRKLGKTKETESDKKN